MHPLATAVLGYLILVLVFVLAWFWQVRTRNAGMVDPVWALSLGLVAVLYAVLADGDPTARWMTGVLGGLWGARLGAYLWLRNIGEPEDGRYARFREQWGASANQNMFWFFQLQAAFSMLLSLAFLVAVYQPGSPSQVCLFGAGLIWLVAVGGEGLADRQLRAFKADAANKGHVCRAGLWRYSRHPNYFFESLHWFSYVALAFASPWVWVTLIAPMVMAWLLLKVSGIPLTEAQSAKSRPEYAEYIRTTSAFIPWPPKS